jgi:hypothetical protein
VISITVIAARKAQRLHFFLATDYDHPLINTSISTTGWG